MIDEDVTYEWTFSPRYTCKWALWAIGGQRERFKIVAYVYPSIRGDGWTAENTFWNWRVENLPTVDHAKRAAEVKSNLSGQPDAAPYAVIDTKPPLGWVISEDMAVDLGPRLGGGVMWIGNVPLVGLDDLPHHELLTGTARIVHHHHTGGRPHTYVYVIERADGRFEMHVARVDSQAKTASTEVHPMTADELDRLAARLGLQPWHIGHRAPANDVGNGMETTEADPLTL
jgi:hypothetical protein